MRIGRTIREMVDRGRDNPFAENGSKRRFMVSIYYPASETGDGEYEASYLQLFHPGEAAAVEFLESCAADLNHLRSQKTNVYHEAGISEAGPFPVLLYSPGFGIERDMYHYHVSKLAASGFIVLTVGAPYDSVFTAFPDGEIIGQLKALSELEGSDLKGWQSLLEIRQQDIDYVLHLLTELNAHDVLLKNKLDLNRIGVVGHSLGGAAAYRQLEYHSAIKACLLLDPSLHLMTPHIVVNSIPLLLMRQHSSTYEMLINDGWNQNTAQETMNGQIRLAAASAGYHSFIKVIGANHLTFSDAPIHANEPDIASKHGVINRLTTAFVKEFVCGQAGEYTKLGNTEGAIRIGSDGTHLN